MHPKQREERAKLLATFLSNLGVAALITGFIAPTFGGFFAPSNAAAGVVIGVLLHIGGQLVLEYVVQTEPTGLLS